MSRQGTRVEADLFRMKRRTEPVTQQHRSLFRVPLVATALAVALLGLFPPAVSARGPKELRPRLTCSGKKPGARERFGSSSSLNVPEIERLSAASAELRDGKTPRRSRPGARRRRRRLEQSHRLRLLEGRHRAARRGFRGSRPVPIHPAPPLRVSPNALALLEASTDVLGITEDKARKLIEPVEDGGETSKGGSRGTRTGERRRLRHAVGHGDPGPGQSPLGYRHHRSRLVRRHPRHGDSDQP